MLYPNQYVWFIFVSALDIMLTWIILHQPDGEEINPIANAVIEFGGLPALTIFKFCLVMFIVLNCEWIGRRNLKHGLKLAEWSVAITCIPVAISFWQLLHLTFG